MNRPGPLDGLLRGSGRTRRRPGGLAKTEGAVKFESLIRKGATLADLDLELAEKFLSGAPGASKPILERLRGYGLIDSDRPDAGVTNGALLLFARIPARHWHPGAGVRVMRVTGTARILGHRQSVTRVGYAGPPIAAAIDGSMELIREQIRASAPLRDIFFEDVPEYPEAAWRETLVNAVAHRDYQGRSETEIVFYDDRVEIMSPGAPVEPVSIEGARLGAVKHAARNPMLVRVLRDAGFMKCEGGGLGSLCKEMEKSLLKEPEFASRGGVFTVTLRNDPVLATSGPGWKNLVRRLPINAQQRRILLARPDGFTQEDYSRLNAVSPGEADDRIRDMADKDIVAPDFEGFGPDRTYYLTADLDSTRFFLEDRVPRLREHFRQESELRSAKYQEIFETSYPVSRRELVQLTELGFLRQGGRGRATHYLPAAGLRK